MNRLLSLLILCAWLAAGCGSPESQLKKARELAGKGKHAEAVQAFGKALAKPAAQPWLSGAWLDLARSQKALAKPAEARSAAEKALAAAKTDSDKLAASLFLAELQAEAKDFDGAEKTLLALGKASESDPRRLAVMTKVAQSRGAAPLAVASQFLNMDAVRMVVGKVEPVEQLDKAEFPYQQRYVDKGGADKIPSPDGKLLLWRGKAKDGYFLFVSDADGKNERKLKDCKNAFQPFWAPDSKRVVYSAMSYKTKKRMLMIYDLEKGKNREAYSSKRGLGAMAAFSPDGSKIAFTYFGELWMMNANGIGRTNVNLKEHIKVPVKEAALLAWKRDGSQLAYQPLGMKQTFVIHFAIK